MSDKSEFKHIPVLLEESVKMLNIQKDGIYVDGTLGGGGHSYLVCEKLGNGRLIGIDRDIDAITAAKKKLKAYSNTITIVHNNFKTIRQILNELNIHQIDGAILDLGVSSHQLDIGERGFSYNADAPLDMRMDKQNSISAFDVVNGYSEDKLASIIYKYGEDKFGRQIAKAIVRARSQNSIKTTFELRDIIKSAMPPSVRYADKHPAKRTFQAVRIEVNGELEGLDKAIYDFADVLAQCGRLAVITFHSLEDRIIKQAFAELAGGCTCPKDFPVCICGKQAEFKPVNKKPIIAQQKELSENNRAHSAKLRVLEKL